MGAHHSGISKKNMAQGTLLNGGLPVSHPCETGIPISHFPVSLFFLIKYS